MKLRRREWPTCGWLYRFHKMIRWQLVARFAFKDVKVAAPKDRNAHLEVFKQSQLGFEF